MSDTRSTPGLDRNDSLPLDETAERADTDVAGDAHGLSPATDATAARRDPSRFVVADPTRCVACYACVQVCIAVHRAVGLTAQPRLVVTQAAQAAMPVQCRHCEDAPCVPVCPVGAITRSSGGVQLDESACIGCKKCAIVCPYGAIDRYVRGSVSGQFPILSLSAEDVAPAALVDAVESPAATNGGSKVAVKCDLCHFRGAGPICVEVCATQALILVDGTRNTAAGAIRRRDRGETVAIAPEDSRNGAAVAAANERKRRQSVAEFVRLFRPSSGDE